MRLILAIFLAPFLACGQANPDPNSREIYKVLDRFLHVENITASTQRFTRFVDRLEQKTNSTDQQLLLRQLFIKTHSRFLRTFKPSASFSELFSNGNYNCLTATALFAVALKRLGYDYSVIETAHHIFIVVETDRGRVLLETTDAFNGFTTDAKSIITKIESYKSQAATQVNPTTVQYQFRSPLFAEVSLENIVGLLHYNMSVNAYNKKSFSAATDHLERASAYYQSPRLVELSHVILLTLKTSGSAEAATLGPRLYRIKRTAGTTALISKKL